MRSLEDEMMDAMSKDIAKEIYEGIMAFMLAETGWTPVKFHFKDNYHANDVTFWLLENCKGKWRRLGAEYLFEDTKEAEWFMLRWT